MAVFMEVADLVVLFAMGTLKNVLKRGYYKDFVVTAQHGIILGACLLLYLFMLQEGQQYSRLALVLNIVIYILLTYLVRELWKHLLRKKMEDGKNRSLLLVVSADVVSSVVESMKEHNYARYKIAGIAVIDKEMTGKYIDGVKVVANMENAAEYVCKEWIDEVLIVTSGVVPYPKELIEQFTETGVTVHLNLAKVQSVPGKKQFVEKVGDYTVLTTSINYASTDNLLISSFVGIISAGIYSNYYLIIGSVRQVLEQAMLGVAASVGNLGVTEENEKIGRIFDSLFFIGYWLFGFAGVCLLELLNPFVKLAFGKKYLFPKEIVLILCINFFINGMRRAVLIFKESMGLFWNDRYKAIAEAVLNLVISILLVTYFGVAGVFAGTFCSTVLTSVWVEPYVIYKYRLKKPVTGFFVKYAGYLGVMAAVWGITEYFCRFISGQAFMILVCRLGICLIVPNILLWFAYRRTAEWKVLWNLLKKIVEKVFTGDKR